jgi:hypothetical protein
VGNVAVAEVPIEKFSVIVPPAAIFTAYKAIKAEIMSNPLTKHIFFIFLTSLYIFSL